MQMLGGEHIFISLFVLLALARDPPLSVVRKFVHLLEQSPLDLQEEQEVTRLREEVVTNIRSNQQMEKDLNVMDIKIGLLVKNRITLQVGSTFPYRWEKSCLFHKILMLI